MHDCRWEDGPAAFRGGEGKVLLGQAASILQALACHLDPENTTCRRQVAPQGLSGVRAAVLCAGHTQTAPSFGRAPSYLPLLAAGSSALYGSSLLHDWATPGCVCPRGLTGPGPQNTSQASKSRRDSV